MSLRTCVPTYRCSISTWPVTTDPQSDERGGSELPKRHGTLERLASQMALAIELMHAMTGKDTNVAWSAAWKIIRCTDDAVLAELTYHIEAFQRARKRFPFVKGIRDRRVDLYLAILVLEAYRDKRCRCTLYPKFEMFSVQNEAQLGFVAIKSSVVHRELWEEHFQVECCGCGTRHACKTIEGYHFPLWRWELA